MSRMERIYQIDQLLASRKAVSGRELRETLGIAEPTVKRDIVYMRDRLHAPIIYDRSLKGYRFESNQPSMGPAYELPGLWFSAEEIHALLTMQHLLTHLDAGGLLGPHIQPLLARLQAMLQSGDEPANHIQQRVRILAMGARDFHIQHFQRIGSALLRRKRLRIEYQARGHGETSQRAISPQRLIHYRDNWYLDAWCHLREGLRSFAMDAILEAEELNVEAIEIPSDALDTALSQGYGIFSGEKVAWATLRFSPERARWVAKEHWHPQQKGKWLPDGGYELKIPYSKDPELIMDILKHGRHCTVIGPQVLVDRVTEELRANLKGYAAFNEIITTAREMNLEK